MHRSTIADLHTIVIIYSGGAELTLQLSAVDVLAVIKSLTMIKTVHIIDNPAGDQTVVLSPEGVAAIDVTPRVDMSQLMAF